MVFHQDFALDPEEKRIHLAALHMVRFMAAGMSLITCRQAVIDSLTSNITKAFVNALRLNDTVSEHALVIHSISLATRYYKRTRAIN